MPVTLAELAKRFQGKVRGNPDTRIESVAALETAGPHEIAYVSDGRYLALLSKTTAGAVILTEADADRFSGNVLLVENPHLCFAQIAALLHPLPTFRPGIHATAVVNPKARVAATSWIGPYSVIESEAVIEDGVWIGSGCYVGSNVLIASRTRLFAHVAIYDRCTLGQDCLIHSGVVIGCDGFGYSKNHERWQKMPQLGRAIIGNLVEIGANTTIDRGALNDTVIGDGVKLDNQIHIAHNVQIGENTAIAACVGIAGSTVIGKRCTVGGQAGFVGHIEIADDVHITAGSLVTNSITKAGVYSSSLKAEPVEKWRRNSARLHHLDEIARRLGKLESKLQQRSKEQKN
jgi:UDP-3-O-[3-hydroxymyristoyl] glucosamine N-acyltransferase